MQKTTISIIGAGSIIFTGRLIVDLCITESLHGCNVVLMDVDRERLDMMYNLATRYVNETNANISIKKTTDRRESLEDADFVINTVKIGGYGPMEEERRIAEKHGYYRGIGERVSDYYGGIGAYHQLKFFLELAEDMEEYCPEAWLIQTANPVFEGTTLIHRQSRIKVVGICHGHLGYKEILKVLKMNEEDVKVLMAGFNHNIWLKEFRYKGEDAYPLLDKWIREEAQTYWNSTEYLQSPPWFSEQLSPAAVETYRLYGLFPIGDTVRSATPWWFHENFEIKKKWFGPTGGFDSEIGWTFYLNLHDEIQKVLQQLASDPSIEITKFYTPSFSGEQHIPLIDALVNDKQTILQLNIPNNGTISGIPDDVVVEIPALVDSGGIKGIYIGSLPKKIMLFNMIPRMLQMERILHAFLQGDKTSLILTNVDDHRTRTFEQASNVVEEILNQPWNKEPAAHYR